MKLLYLSILALFFYLSTSAQQDSSIKKSSFNLYVDASLCVFKPVASGYKPFGYLVFETNITTAASVGVEWRNSSKRFKNFAIDASISYCPFVHRAAGYDVHWGGAFDYAADGYMFTNNILLLYYFPKKNRFNVYVGTGVGTNFTHYKNSYTVHTMQDFVAVHNTNTNFRKIWFNGQIRGGILYKKKVAVELCATGGRLTREKNYSFDLYTYAATLKYYLF